jgi:Cu/Ag efflux pump CusA
VVVVSGIALSALLGQSLLPSLQERDLLVNWNTAPGTSHAETYRIVSRVSRELQGLPGVRKVGAHVGRAITGDQIVGINSSQIWVSIDPKAHYEKTLAAIRETIEGYPGADRNIQSYLRDKVSEVLTGASTPVVVRIYGPKPEVLREKAEEVKQALSTVRGLVDVQSEGQAEEPQVQIRVNLDAAGRENVKPGDLRRASATVFAGLNVGYMFEEQKILDVVVWGAPETRDNLSNLRNLWVGRSDRHRVRLGDVAEVSIVPTPTVIRHESISPYVDVVANVSGRDLSGVIKEIEERLDRIQFPLEHNPRILGEYAERLSVQQRVLGISVAVVVGIFLLLQACLRSWLLALIAFLALPAAVAGGVLAAAATGGGISLGSLVGFLAVLGIAARNALLLINHYQRVQEEENIPFGVELVRRGARERLAATLASSAAIVAALLPIIVSGQIPGLEILQPMAIVIVGGVIASTLVTLFVIPSLYMWVGARAQREPELDLAAS